MPLIEATLGKDLSRSLRLCTVFVERRYVRMRDCLAAGGRDLGAWKHMLDGGWLDRHMIVTKAIGGDVPYHDINIQRR